MLKAAIHRTSLLLFFSLYAVAAHAAAPLRFQRAAPVIPGEFIVRMREPHSLWAKLEKVLNVAGGFAEVRPLDEGRTFLLRSKQPGSRAERLALEALEKVAALIEPNARVRALEIPIEMPRGFPKDPGIENSWHLRNAGAAGFTGQEGFPGADLHVAELWEKGITGRDEILVAVIDTGIQFGHPDLRDAIYVNPGEIPGNGIDDDGNGYVDDVRGWNFNRNYPDANDDNGHGTHVAGLIGAVAGNGIGSAGVARNVKLLSLKFLDSHGSGDTASAIQAIAYARKMGARILNNSWGGDPYSQALRDAIEEARRAGILFVAAAGNDAIDNDSDPLFPASYDVPNVVSVAATDNRDGLASFSNYGARTVHVAAPGLMIYSTYKGDYEYFSGTSMATPMVSGVAALVWSYFPELSPEAIKERLIRSCDPSYALKRRIVCQGRINAWNGYHGIEPDKGPRESEWLRREERIESPHPYLPGTDDRWVVRVPGARYVRVHFREIDSEEFDRVAIESPRGEVAETLSGRITHYFSEPVRGDTLVVRFKTDLSLEKFGFVVDFVEYVP